MKMNSNLSAFSLLQPCFEKLKHKKDVVLSQLQTVGSPWPSGLGDFYIALPGLFLDLGFLKGLPQGEAVGLTIPGCLARTALVPS